MVRAVLKSYRKNILREMKDNLSRMVSLFGIVALGVMMLTGLMSFAPSMRIAGQKYYVQQNVFDLRVLSTLGLSEEDIAAIAAVDGVEAVQPVKYQDVEAQWQGQSETAVVRLQQLPADPGADTAGLRRPGGTGHGAHPAGGHRTCEPEAVHGSGHRAGPAAFFHGQGEQHRR